MPGVRVRTAGGWGYAAGMRVQVLFFGVLRELAGGGERELTLPERATAGELVAGLRDEMGDGAERVWPTMAIAVNEVYAGREQVLTEGDVVALLPPVSGGTGESWSSRRFWDSWDSWCSWDAWDVGVLEGRGGWGERQRR